MEQNKSTTDVNRAVLEFARIVADHHAAIRDYLIEMSLAVVWHDMYVKSRNGVSDDDAMQFVISQMKVKDAEFGAALSERWQLTQESSLGWKDERVQEWEKRQAWKESEEGSAPEEPE